MDVVLRQDHRISILRPSEALACLSWAPHMPGDDKSFVTPIHAVVNYTLTDDERGDLGRGAVDFCNRVLRDEALDPRTSITLLTVVPQEQLQHCLVERESTGLEVRAFCTAGIRSAIAPGDPTLYDEEFEERTPEPGTINIITIINRQLTQSAMLELTQVITMAKCQAMYRIGAVSRLSNRIALGTGTDCIVVGGLRKCAIRLRYGGMHVKLAELTACAVDEVVTRAIEGQRAHLAATAEM
ncbi:MAG: adenosylcobinamide amidohydrolase [Candidatus Uhrbacteria bacterium]